MPGRSLSGLVVVLTTRPLVTRRTSTRAATPHRRPPATRGEPWPVRTMPDTNALGIHTASGPTPLGYRQPPRPARLPGASADLTARQALRATVGPNPRCATSASGLPDKKQPSEHSKPDVSCSPCVWAHHKSRSGKFVGRIPAGRSVPNPTAATTSALTDLRRGAHPPTHQASTGPVRLDWS